MKEKLQIAVIGCGDFAKSFVPLFNAHPNVEKVYVCDIDRQKAEDYAEKFDVEIIESFEAALENPDINAVAIFTQRHLHGPMSVAALKAKKHVYSAVPMGISPEECKAIIDAVKENKRTYMMGETCIYYPCSMYCKKEYEKGTFGSFVYAESQYFHDISHFSKEFIEDKPNSAVPPFFYPTHSTSMVLHATGAYATKVTAFGYKDTEKDTPFEKGKNPWDNEFSNEFSLMQLSNGGIARISECRRIGYKAPSSFISGFYGTRGSYQFNNAQHLLVKMNNDDSEYKVKLTDVSDEVNPYNMTENKESDPDFKIKVANHSWQWKDRSPIQDEKNLTLPAEFKNIPSGHMYSHKFLIDDFCKAAYEEKMPYVNAWTAARYTIPGLIAHKSATLGGVTLDIPDYGDAPEKL